MAKTTKPNDSDLLLQLEGFRTLLGALEQHRPPPHQPRTVPEGVIVTRAPDAYSALHVIAERLEPGLRKVFLDAVAGSLAAIDLERLAALLLAGQIDAAAAAGGIAQLTQGLGAVQPILEMGFKQGGQAAASALTRGGLAISFDLTNPRAVIWAGQYSGALITEIADETRAGIRTLIEAAFTDGLHPYDVARRIRDWIGLTSRQQGAVARLARALHEQGVDPEVVERRTQRYAASQLRYRAKLIARTETLASSNYGQDELWAQAREQGLLSLARTKRVWLVTDDDRLDEDICEPMEDQKVGLHEPFVTPQGRTLQVPPAHPNCRCTVGLEIAER